MTDVLTIPAPPARHRRRWLLVGVVTVAALVAGGAWLLWPATPATPAALPTTTVAAGTVQVQLTPVALNATGATFRVVLDTHSGSLDADLAAVSRLQVEGRAAAAPTWTGAPPGGHHREGTLRFGTPVPPGSRLELRIDGLPQPVSASWTAP